MESLLGELFKKYGQPYGTGYIADVDTSNKINRIAHAYHVRFGYPKGCRPKVSKAKRKRIYLRDKGICAYCGKKLPINHFVIDHVIPLAKGGNNEDSNLTVSCAKCNQKKWTNLVKPRYVRGKKVGSIND